jgi:PAS domain S-box-containing protein
MTGEVARYAAYLLILLSAGNSLLAVWRRRETHRLDILALIALILLGPFRQGFGAFGIGLLLAQPYVLFRLIDHFFEVPALLMRSALAAIAAGIVAFAVSPAPYPRALSLVAAIYVVAGQLSAAAAFSQEAGRRTGVTSKRLAFAACGTWLLAAAFSPAVIAPLLSGPWRFGGQLAGWLTAGMLASYYLAFSTPRWLRSAWQRTEQARYLSLSADLDAEERGQRTATDLSLAAARTASNALALVALRPAPGSTELVVQAASAPALVNLDIANDAGLIDRAIQSRAPVEGPSEDCGGDFGARLRPYGPRALVAPVMTTTRTWGVVLVVQRRGSIFPEDDLRLLAQLGRFAGTALDHAYLVIEARERERKAADRRLREAESRMSLMLDNIRDYAMFVLDHLGRVVIWHIGAEGVFGYSAREMADEAAAPLYQMTDDEFLGLLQEARLLGRAEREGECRRRDGGRFLGATSIRPFIGDDSELQGFVCVTRDVTRARDLEQQLRQSQKMDAIGRLAGGIAHDFNNLLAAIVGYADLLSQDLGSQAPFLQPIDQIHKAADRAADLIRQLLAFSRQQIVQPLPVNLSRLAADLLPLLRRVIGEHIEIVDETALEISAVLGDRSQLEQVIVNLAVNARDAMPSGGRLTIRTSNVWLGQAAAGTDLLPGPHALLEVIDTGVGMDAATQARIFEPFFTTKEIGRGTGLGLATVYGIVKQMGGSVRVESLPRAGTAFRLYFPETQVREPVPPPVGPLDTPRGTETLLVVDDDEAVRSFLTQLLERNGYRVIAAGDPASALQLAAAYSEAIHLVITDVVMPGSTGPELVRALNAARPGLPALYISGYADAVLTRHGTSPKASHFLQKPFSAPELLTRIRHILSRS